MRPKRVISLFLALSLIFQQTGFSEPVMQLNLAARFAGVQKDVFGERFQPPHLRSLFFDPDSLSLNVLLDKGSLKELSPAKTKALTAELLKYFFIGVSLPNDSFWVNLRPDQPDYIIDPEVEKTDVGKLMLEADLQLKKDTASFTSPDTLEGRQYWDKLYKKAGELFGTEQVEIPTFIRPWIVPGEIIIREQGAGDREQKDEGRGTNDARTTEPSAYIYKATLKVMLEEDYIETVGAGSQPALKGQRWAGLEPAPTGMGQPDPRYKALNEYASELMRQLIIPKLARDVNTARRYAPLRQVYYSLILAQWYKERNRAVVRHPSSVARPASFLELIDSRNLQGLTSQAKWSKMTYFQEYQRSFKDGEYRKSETVSTTFGPQIRNYTSGGFKMPDLFGSSSVTIKPGEVTTGAASSTIVIGSAKGMLFNRKQPHLTFSGRPGDVAADNINTGEAASAITGSSAWVRPGYEITIRDKELNTDILPIRFERFFTGRPDLDLFFIVNALNGEKIGEGLSSIRGVERRWFKKSDSGEITPSELYNADLIVKLIEAGQRLEINIITDRYSLGKHQPNAFASPSRVESVFLGKNGAMGAQDKFFVDHLIISVPDQENHGQMLALDEISVLPDGRISLTRYKNDGSKRFEKDMTVGKNHFVTDDGILGSQGVGDYWIRIGNQGLIHKFSLGLDIDGPLAGVRAIANYNSPQESDLHKNDKFLKIVLSSLASDFASGRIEYQISGGEIIPVTKAVEVEMSMAVDSQEVVDFEDGSAFSQGPGQRAYPMRVQVNPQTGDYLVYCSYGPYVYGYGKIDPQIIDEIFTEIFNRQVPPIDTELLSNVFKMFNLGRPKGTPGNNEPPNLPSSEPPTTRLSGVSSAVSDKIGPVTDEDRLITAQIFTLSTDGKAKFNPMRGQLPWSNLKLRDDLLGILMEGGIDEPTAKSLANTIARMREGNLEMMRLAGVINQKEFDSLKAKDLSGLSPDEQNSLSQGLKEVVDSYQVLPATHRQTMMKNLLPLRIIQAVARQENMPLTHVFTVASDYPDFPRQILKSQEIIKDLAIILGASEEDLGWHLTSVQGVDGVLGWAKDIKKWLDEIKDPQIMQVAGGKRHLWIELGRLPRNRWQSDSAKEDAIERIMDKVGGPNNARVIIALQGGEEGAKEWITAAEELFGQVESIVGSKEMAWKVLIALDIDGVLVWLEKQSHENFDKDESGTEAGYSNQEEAIHEKIRAITVDDMDMVKRLWEMEAGQQEYGLKGGKILRKRVRFNYVLSQLLNNYIHDSFKARLIAQKITRMNEGSLEMMSITGVISLAELKTIISLRENRDSLSTYAMRDQLGENLQGMYARLVEVIDSYDRLLSAEYWNKMARRLIPLEIIKAISEKEDIPFVDVLSIACSHPDFPVWIERAKTVLPGLLAVINSVDSGRDRLTTAWYILRAQGLEHALDWAKEVRKLIERIEDPEAKKVLGDNHQIWLRMTRLGKVRGIPSEKDKEVFKNVLAKVGYPSYTRIIMFAQGVDYSEKWVDKVLEVFEQVQAKAGTPGKTWHIFVALGIEGAQRWAQGQDEKDVVKVSPIGSSAIIENPQGSDTRRLDLKGPGTDTDTANPDKMGGVDFRNLPILTQPVTLEMIHPDFIRSLPCLSEAQLSGLKQEHADLGRMIAQGIAPSIERISEFVAGCCQEMESEEDVKMALSLVASVVEMQESQFLPTDSRIMELLVFLESQDLIAKFQEFALAA